MKSKRDSVADSRAIARVLATKAQDTRSKKMAWEAGLKAKGSPENTTVGDPEPKMQAENPTAIHGVSDGDQKGRIKGGIGNIKNGGKHSTPLQTQMTQRNTETTVPDSTRMTGDQGAVDQTQTDGIGEDKEGYHQSPPPRTKTALNTPQHDRMKTNMETGEITHLNTPTNNTHGIKNIKMEPMEENTSGAKTRPETALNDPQHDRMNTNTKTGGIACLDRYTNK